MRAELLGQLVAAQFEIEAAMNEIAGNAAALSDGKAQLQLLTALQRQIGTASSAALAGMRSEIIAVANATQAIAQQSRASANASDTATTLADVTNKTRRTIQNVAQELFEQKKLDPYLQFVSAEDEAEYRKREAARKAYIDAELAKGTPQGALNAAAATREQLEDARDHGADRSPNFARMLAETEDAERTLSAAMPREAAPPAKQAEPPKVADDFSDVLSAFRDAGVTITETVSADPAHGLAQGKPVVPSKQV